jgi:hypothetical protein
VRSQGARHELSPRKKYIKPRKWTFLVRFRIGHSFGFSDRAAAFARNAAAAYSFIGTVRRASALIPDIKAHETATLMPAAGIEMRGNTDDPCRQVLPAKLEKLFR